MAVECAIRYLSHGASGNTKYECHGVGSVVAQFNFEDFCYTFCAHPSFVLVGKKNVDNNVEACNASCIPWSNK